MPVDILANLIILCAEVDKSIRTQTRDRNALDDLIASYRNWLNAPLAESQPFETEQLPEETKTPYHSVLFYLAKIIQSNRPLSINTLYRLLIENGFVIATPKPKSTLSARLRDYSPKLGFTFLSKHGWWLNDRHYPPASFYPPQSAMVADLASEQPMQPATLA